MEKRRPPKLRRRGPRPKEESRALERPVRELGEEGEGVFAGLHEIDMQLAMAETRSLTLPVAQGGVPAGSYEFMESYCAGPGCDCRRVIFMVHRAAAGRGQPQHVMNVGFGWEPLSFYAEQFRVPLEEAGPIKGPALELLGPTSPYADELLALFAQTCLADPSFVDRLARHYRVFKEGLRTPAR